jgi:tetraacyldisaccharide 4'-kinase
VIPANEPALEGELRRWGWKKPVWRLNRLMEIPAMNGPVAVFCGIARPEQFFAGIKAAGFEIALQKAFPDHHSYTARDLDRFALAARAAGATALLTTEKDMVRLGKSPSELPRSLPLTTAHLRIEIEDEIAAIEWLIRKLDSAPAPSPL